LPEPTLIAPESEIDVASIDGFRASLSQAAQLDGGRWWSI
jgi:hypothetical protein